MNEKNSKKFVFHVHGMHCASCEILTEDAVREDARVSSVKSNVRRKQIEISGDFGEKKQEDVMRELNAVLVPNGYTLSLEREKTSVRWKDFRIAIPVALLVIVIFFGLQKLGIVNMVRAENMNYGTAFLIGIVASLSSCMAVVGGLVLSLSASFAREGKNIAAQVQFHFGRIIGFFLLGGLTGSLGSLFQFGPYGIFLLGLFTGMVMLFLGIRLLDIFPKGTFSIFKKPKQVSRAASHIAKMNWWFAPALAGAATFFLPCGFTQSMQVYALSTGSFFSGSLTMVFFALGTFPVLALLSFSSFVAYKGKTAGIFFKTVGCIIIAFSVYNILNSFVAVGFIQPIFNF